MILVDTSVWVDFLRDRPSTQHLDQLLRERAVACHPWIMGELMVGELGTKRQIILATMALLPMLPVYAVEDLHSFVETQRLYGRGLSFVDVQLLYGTIAGTHQLWTHDKPLHRTATRYGKSYIGG